LWRACAGPHLPRVPAHHDAPPPAPAPLVRTACPRCGARLGRLAAELPVGDRPAADRSAAPPASAAADASDMEPSHAARDVACDAYCGCCGLVVPGVAPVSAAPMSAAPPGVAGGGR
jgi:hypothetical protein